MEKIALELDKLARYNCHRYTDEYKISKIYFYFSISTSQNMIVFKLSEYNEESEKNGYNSIHPICIASSKEDALIATFISFDPKMGGNSTPNINHIHIIDEWLQHLDAHIQTNRPFEMEDTLSVTFKNGEAKFWMEWKPEEFTIIDVKSLKSIIEDWKNYILNWLKNT